jgi:hypothetical protein
VTASRVLLPIALVLLSSVRSAQGQCHWEDTTFNQFQAPCNGSRGFEADVAQLPEAEVDSVYAAVIRTALSNGNVTIDPFLGDSLLSHSSGFRDALPYPPGLRERLLRVHSFAALCPSQAKCEAQGWAAFVLSHIYRITSNSLRVYCQYVRVRPARPDGSREMAFAQELVCLVVRHGGRWVVQAVAIEGIT